MLEDRNVNLRVMEKEDIDFVAEFNNAIGFLGEYHPIEEQISKSE